MKSKKKFTIIAIIVIALAIIIGTILIVLKTKGKENTITETSKSENNNKKSTSQKEKNDSLIIKGVEYIDTSKNFKDVNKDKFSFFCNQERTKYLTYKKSDEKSKIETKVIYNFDGRVSAVFNIRNRGTEIIVSDENFEVDGKKLVTDAKTLLFEENNLKCYIDEYKKGYYMHQYITKINGIEVSIYTASKTKGDETLKSAVKEIIGDLSVDKNVGFYLDQYLSYDGLNGIALKSYKLIGAVNLISEDEIVLNGHTFDYIPIGYGTTYVPSDMVDYGKIKDKNVGYYISKSKYGDKLIIYIYSNIIEAYGSKIFQNTIQTIWLNDYDEGSLKAEDAIKLYLDNIVVY